MEKIIAVVVMIAIVVGLIAAVILPMSGSITKQGEGSQRTLDSLTAGLESGQVLGSVVKGNFRNNLTNIRVGASATGSWDTDANDPAIKFTVTNGTNTAFSGITGTVNKDALNSYVKDSEVYSEEITYYSSGKIKTMTYKIVQ